jgi:hypothetical protein
MSPEELKERINDANLRLIVLLQILIEHIEFLEENKYIYGSIKQFLKNGKAKFERFIGLVFQEQGKVDEDDALTITGKLFVMQERVERALLNQYIIPVDERRRRTKEILSKYMISPIVDKAMQELEEVNAFNF